MIAFLLWVLCIDLFVCLEDCCFVNCCFGNWRGMMLVCLVVV